MRQKSKKLWLTIVLTIALTLSVVVPVLANGAIGG